MRRLASFSFLTLLCLMRSPIAPASETPPPAPIAFDWFEYTGRDDTATAPLAAGHYRNPILPGFYPDPSVCRVGDDFYLINSTFAYFPGIPVFHSRDLVHWTQLGHVIDRPAQLNYDGLGVSRALFAPAISHHDGTFYVVCTMVDGGGNFLVTAKNPAGPWSDPVWLGFDGIDPSIFFDDATGRAWLVNNGNPPDNRPLYEGHRAIWQQEFDVKTRKLIGPRTIIVNGGVDLAKKPIWVEGPHLFRRGEWYYLCCAEGGTSEGHSQVIFRSQSPTGPFTPWDRNPILTQRDLDGTVPHAVTSTGHADLFVGPDGNWWSVFLGCRPYGGKWYATGRETFLLPVTWTDDGWPTVLPHGQRVPLTAPAPKSALVSPAATPLSDNFTWRDDFAADRLSPLWIMLRQPHETWWQLDATKESLGLAPRSATLGGKDNPSYLARRLQHARFDIATKLAPPAAPGTAGGLVAFQSETHHYFFGVRRDTAGTLEVFLEKSAGPKPEVIASSKLPADTAAIELRLKGDEAAGEFAYSIKPCAWTVLAAHADLTILTTQASWGFVGATVGLHARLER